MHPLLLAAANALVGGHRIGVTARAAQVQPQEQVAEYETHISKITDCKTGFTEHHQA